MINWENIKYNIDKANKDFDNLTVDVDGITPIEPSYELDSIRVALIKARDDIFDEKGYDTANKLDYEFDLLFGLRLYEILSTEIGFTNRTANNEDVWRYLSLKVIPDIVHARWGMNADHMFKMGRRIWLKQIWWYIHLSWSGDAESTYEILKTNTSDTILQLVERPGIGYYVNTYRALMKEYTKHDDSTRNIFRHVLKLNTARLITTAPELVEGGVEGYVKQLFDSVENG